MKRLLLLGLGLVCSQSLIALGGGGSPPPSELPQREDYPPWFTGPLLTTSASVVPVGYINFEPYTFVTVTSGEYNDHWHGDSAPDFITVNWQTPLYIGLTEWLDLYLVGQANWNSTQGVSNLEFGDSIVRLDFQLLAANDANTVPATEFYVQETFPTGRYQRLDPQKLETDSGGEGTFATEIGLVISPLFHISGLHYLSLRFNPFYTFNSKVSVKGANIYGGTRDTKGTVNPGNSFGFFSSAEYNLTRNWALAVDLVGIYQSKTTFKGRPGITASGAPAVLDAPELIHFSLAPAIEYNFSAQLGIIAGAWFTFAGKNAPRFASGVIALNYFGPISEKKHPYLPPGGGGTGGGGH